jgi:hypothetical protein
MRSEYTSLLNVITPFLRTPFSFLKSWRYYVGNRSLKKLTDLEKPFFMVERKKEGREAVATRDVTFTQRYEGNEKSVSPGKWVSRITR